MTQAPTRHKSYVSDFQALERNGAGDGPDWLAQIREHALSRFSELGFPTARRGNERWKYTNVGPIAKATFKYSVEPAPNGLTVAELKRRTPWRDGWANLVFVDGHYAPGLSTPLGDNDGVRATSLAEAIASEPELVKRHLGRHAPIDDDGFAALNTAFVRDGAFVHIPEGRALDRPLHLLFVSTGHEEPTVSYPRVLVVAGAGSKATLVESYVGLTEGRYFTNGVSEMVVEDETEVDHHRLLNESASAFHVGVARVRLGRNSTYDSKSFQKGVGLGRYDLDVLLDGAGGSCVLNGLYLTSGNQHVDNLINIDHAKPHATSRLNYKGILDGRSRAVFGGTVLVREGAVKTNALQSDKNLVLSPDAEVDSKPALFIYADDVKCGHGATAGNIDQDMVFYLRSRGLDLEEASRLLIYGFAGEIIETVRVDALREYLEELFLQSLPSYRFEF